jgi:hypothetical protein
VAHRVNDKFVSANFVVSQLKDREQRLKKDYNAVKTIMSKSGFGWWSELPEKLQKWKNMSFPYYDDLHEIYNGMIKSIFVSSILFNHVFCSLVK